MSALPTPYLCSMQVTISANDSPPPHPLSKVILITTCIWFLRDLQARAYRGRRMYIWGVCTPECAPDCWKLLRILTYKNMPAPRVIPCIMVQVVGLHAQQVNSRHLRLIGELTFVGTIQLFIYLKHRGNKYFCYHPSAIGFDQHQVPNTSI